MNKGIDKTEFRYYDPDFPEDCLDAVGGSHYTGQCYAPDGRFCGERNKLSCNGCKIWNCGENNGLSNNN